MKNIIILMFMVFSFKSVNALASDTYSEVLVKEYNTLYELVKVLKPDYDIGDYYQAKVYGDVELIWKLAADPQDFDVIKIYSEHTDGSDDFAVTFFRGDHIVKGTNIIRRFIGPIITGWRNDSVNLETGEYIGRQGLKEPIMSSLDDDILVKWNIQPFND